MSMKTLLAAASLVAMAASAQAEVKIGMAVQAFIGEIDCTKLILFRQA